MSVNNLGIALSQLAAVTRSVDASLLSARSTDAMLQVDAPGIAAATGAVEAALGPTMPDGIRTSIQDLPTGATIAFQELVSARVVLSRLGAAGHGVAALGGPDEVALAGGLAAIDGASTIVRQRMHDDATGMLRAAGTVVDWGPARFTSEAERTNHVERLRTALAAPDAIMRDSAGVATGLDNSLPFMATDRAYYRRDLGRLRDKVEERLAWQEVGAREPSGFADRNLVASDSAHVAMRALLADIPALPALARLPADELVATAVPALERHTRILDKVIDHVGDATYYHADYRRALTGVDEHLGAAMDDLAVLRATLSGGPDELRAALASTDVALGELRSYYAGNSRRTPANGQESLPVARAALGEVESLVRSLVESPRLQRVGTDVAEEVVEVLERRGPMDVVALRQVIDDAGAPLAAREALVASVGRLHALTDAAPAASVPQARQLLAEATVIGDAVLAAAHRTDAETKLLLNDATLVHAVQEVRARTVASLGMADRVPEAHGNQLRQGLDTLARRMAATPEAPSYEQPETHTLDTLMSSIRAFDSSLAARAERAQIDGGLRSINPSQRPRQAYPAEVNWLLRELDQLPPVAADAPAELHVDAAARRLSTIANLLDATTNGFRGVDDATRKNLHSAVTARIRTELATQDDLWRMPDDVARSLTEVGKRLEPNSDEVFQRAGRSSVGATDRLRSGAASLRAWSMLQDGALPADTIDRIAVGDRRASALVTAAASVPRTAYDNPRPQLHAWLHDVDVRLADLDATLGPQMPAAERAAVDDALRAVRTYADDAWDRRMVGDEIEIDTSVTGPAREGIDELARAISQTHSQLRATRSGEATW